MTDASFPLIEGVRLGHAEDLDAATGVTVVLTEGGAVGGVSVRGGAPGTRETDLLRPRALVQEVHAVVLAGGSAFGLDAAGGVMRYLEERGVGFDVGVAKVPIVCSAVLFDLVVGDSTVRPDAEMGFRACEAAEPGGTRRGNVGAGAGASVGKVLGIGRAMKGGLGCAEVAAGDLVVGAVVAVNCLGDVVDPEEGTIIAGALAEDGSTFVGSERVLAAAAAGDGPAFGNTTIGAVITNARLTKAEATMVASMAQDGYARTMWPAHTMYDGDTVFVLATGDVEADTSLVGALAARVVERAVVSGVRAAEPLGGLRCHADIVP